MSLSSPSRGSRPHTTQLLSPQDLYVQLRDSITTKLDQSATTHEITYGVLMRELERVLTDNTILQQTATDEKHKRLLTEDELRRAVMRGDQLELRSVEQQAQAEEQERRLLTWQQRCEVLESDVTHLRRELERVVEEADHNRQLLAQELRHRNEWLKEQQKPSTERQSTSLYEEPAGGSHTHRGEDTVSQYGRSTSEQKLLQTNRYYVLAEPSEASATPLPHKVVNHSTDPLCWSATPPPLLHSSNATATNRGSLLFSSGGAMMSPPPPPMHSRDIGPQPQLSALSARFEGRRSEENLFSSIPRASWSQGPQR